MRSSPSAANYELNSTQKSQLMKQMDGDYSKNSEKDDLELFKALSESYNNEMSKLQQVEDETEKGGEAVEATAPVTAATTSEEVDGSSETKEVEGALESPPTVQRIDSVAGHQVGAVKEDSDSDSDHEIFGLEQYDVSKKGKLLEGKTSRDMMKDAVIDEEKRNAEMLKFLSDLKGGSIKTSTASAFRTRRLTYAQKTHQDPEPVSPDARLSRKRTTIFKSDEIGMVRQGKEPPFPDTQMGTFSCHGIEPNTLEEDEYDEEEDAYYGPEPLDKINQDRGCVVYPYNASPDTALFIVLDGHGEQGDRVSDFVMRQIVVSLEKEENLATEPEEALKTTFVGTNTALLSTDINYMTSGTTCVTVYVKGLKLYVSNCGDSRAVMAVNENGKLKARDLSRDHKPDDPEEQARIESMGGFVRPAPEPGLSARVYLDPEFTMIGLAMGRSIGDISVKPVGVIAEPEVTQFDLDPEDKFMIMASDGVWEFIGSQEAIDIVSAKLDEGCNCTEACQELIEQASQRWVEEEGDYRDDITCIVVNFPLPFQSF